MPRQSDPILIRKGRAEQALAIAKKSKKRRTINADQLGVALAVTQRSAVSLIRELFEPNVNDAPVKVWGTSGVAYELDEVPLFKTIIADCERRLSERDAQNSITDDYRAIKTPETVGAKLTVAEIAVLTRSHRDLERMRREQGDLILAERHRAVVSDLCLFASEAFSSVATEMDADGQWPEDIRASVSEWAVRRQIALHKQFAEYLKDNAEPGED